VVLVTWRGDAGAAAVHYDFLRKATVLILDPWVQRRSEERAGATHTHCIDMNPARSRVITPSIRLVKRAPSYRWVCSHLLEINVFLNCDDAYVGT